MDIKKVHVIAPEIKYEYLDYDDDSTMQLHAWGSSLKEAFEQCGVALFGYMTDLDTLNIETCYQIEAKGDDVEGLLFEFLNKLLHLFMSGVYFIGKGLEITKFDLETYEIVCRCYGEDLTPEQLTEVTEVKKITHSAMQVLQEPERNHYEIFVIIDV